MKKYLLASILLISPVVVSLVLGAGEKWYEGGSLHRVTVGEWRRGAFDNKLATAADWALAHPAVKRQVQTSHSINTLKPFALQLMLCVNEAAAGEGYDNQGASELGAACMILLWGGTEP